MSPLKRFRPGGLSHLYMSKKHVFWTALTASDPCLYTRFFKVVRDITKMILGNDGDVKGALVPENHFVKNLLHVNIQNTRQIFRLQTKHLIYNNFAPLTKSQTAELRYAPNKDSSRSEIHRAGTNRRNQGQETKKVSLSRKLRETHYTGSSHQEGSLYRKYNKIYFQMTQENTSRKDFTGLFKKFFYLVKHD